MAATPTHDVNMRLRSKKDGAWFVAPDLRAHLVADAKAQNTNMTDVALAILHKRYDLAYAANGRATEPRDDDAVDLIRLRVPLPLYNALIGTYGVKYVDGIRALLCAHYGLRVPAKPTRTRRRRPRLTA